MIEYLLGRTRKSERRPAFEKFPMEHAPMAAVPSRIATAATLSPNAKRSCKMSVLVAVVLSYQRRVAGIKKHFLGRGRTTPLGLVHDIWDRTEAQQRGALHAHILVASML